jgi:hypothetical protein
VSAYFALCRFLCNSKTTEQSEFRLTSSFPNVFQPTVMPPQPQPSVDAVPPQCDDTEAGLEQAAAVLEASIADLSQASLSVVSEVSATTANSIESSSSILSGRTIVEAAEKPRSTTSRKKSIIAMHKQGWLCVSYVAL